MTTHEADRHADYGSVQENDELGGTDDPTDEQYDLTTDTDADVADADLEEPVEDEPETTWSREQDAVDEDTDDADDTDDAEDVEPELVAVDDAEDAEPELVAVDDADEPAEPELLDEPDRIDAAAVDGTPESAPLQQLEPVGPDTAIDPGTGSYQDRWGAIQAGFIDDPGRTVESASALVAEIWDEIERSIIDEREGVESRWRTTESSTDDFRVAMQDYRALYDRFIRFSSN
jgi:hypothetical protein